MRGELLVEILVIGNGFDLAHGLPTKYTDFLEFVKMIKIIKEQNIFNNSSLISDAGCNDKNEKLHKAIQLAILHKASADKLEKESEELVNCIEDNFWIDYYLECPMYQKENWIDFESEISKLIRSIDDDMKKGGLDESAIVKSCRNSFLAKRFLGNMNEKEWERKQRANKEIEKLEKDEGKRWSVLEKTEYIYDYENTHPLENVRGPITYKQMISKLEQDLDRLIRALEIYLVEYVNKIDCVILPDIQDISAGTVLSFNYTDTYMRLYDEEESFTDYDYIHGKADLNHSIVTNNMVLGIDEYLSPKRCNKEIEFIAFKKFYQRILKKTGCRYREWIEKIQNKYEEILDAENVCLTMRKNAMRAGNMDKADEWHEKALGHAAERKEMHNLYIFGHSLDVTDKDILRDLILNDNVKTTIYYNKKYYKDGSDDNGKKSLGEKISNLVKVIGQDELIKRTGGGTRTIEFKLQQDIVKKV